MKYILLLVGMLWVNAAVAQKKDSSQHFLIDRSRPSGYMGLFDVNMSVGYQSNARAPKTASPSSSKQTLSGLYTMFHFQESILSNYFWADESDKKLKIGFQETLDFGYCRENRTESYTGTSDIKTTKNAFVFTYEAAGAVVYKINNDMDAGLNYCFFSISYFNQDDYAKYAKFRFRYSNIMAEVSTFGRNAVELKYMRSIDGDREYSWYVGLGYINSNSANYSYNSSKNFTQVNIGLIL